MRTSLRNDLPELPRGLRSRPVDHRGYPVPWFVTEKDADGRWEFRGVTRHRLIQAIIELRCWVCGERLGRVGCFVAGPMCGVNRVSAEPPVHPECGEFAVKSCPFMLLSRSKRREAGIAKNDGAGGTMLDRNPGVTMLWLTKSWDVVRVPNGILHRFPRRPLRVRWFREGRPATRDEVLASIDSGLPLLAQMAESEESLSELHRQRDRLEAFLPTATEAVP